MSLRKTIISALAMLSLTFTVNAADISSKIWEMEPEVFNPAVTIPDSLLQNHSAIIIANMFDIDGDIIATNSLYGRDGTTDVNRCVEIERTMVKILDEKSLEYYSSFEYGEQFRKVRGVQLTEASSDFGARIIKSDGSVRNVDLSEALKVGHGKKGDKDESRKIAIPGLEIGDILDFYYVVNIDREEADLPLFSVVLGKKYPVMNFVLTGRFNKRLTVEIKPRNGAPAPDKSFNPVTERNMIDLRAINLPIIEKKLYSNHDRTSPSLDISILNNVSANIRHFPTARLSGLHLDVPFGAVSRDVAFVASNFNVVDQVTGPAQDMVKSYMKSHPGLTDRQVIDLSWVALCYKIAIDKKLKADDLVTACLFMDLVKKLKLANEESLGIAFYKSRFDKPFNEVSRWTELDYGTIVGDTVYTLNTIKNFRPGEWPGIYQGEQGAAYKGKRKMLDKQFMPSVFELPKVKATANSLTHEATATIDVEGGTVALSSGFKATGAYKSNFSVFTNQNEWLAEVEDLFEVPADKRFVPDKGSVEKRKDFIKEQMLDRSEKFFAHRPSSVNSFEFVSRGVMPGSDAFDMKSDYTFEGLVSEGGPELLFAVGKLFQNTSRLAGEDRTRNIDAWLRAPENVRYKLTLNLPDGYTISEEALKMLSNNVRTKVGQFYTKATINPDGRSITVDMMKRVNVSTVQAREWEQLLQILDAAAAFNEVVIPLSSI